MNVFISFACLLCLYHGCVSLETNETQSEEVYLDILRVLSGNQRNTTCVNDLCNDSQQGESQRSLRQADRRRLPIKRRMPLKNRLCLCPPCPDCVMNTQTSVIEVTTTSEETSTIAPESTSTAEEATTELSREIVKQEIAQLRKEIQIRMKYLNSQLPKPPKDACLQNRIPPARDPGRIPPGRLPPQHVGRTPPPRMPPRPPPSRRPPPRRPPRPHSPFKPLGTLFDFVRRIKTVGKSVFLKIIDPLGLNPLISRDFQSRQSRLTRSSMEDESDWKDSSVGSLPSKYKQVRIDDDLSFSVLTD